MTIRLSLCLLLFSSSFPLWGQSVVISDDSTYMSQGSHTLLELYTQSADKGLLLPRLNAAQRENILPNAQETGLLVYDSTSQRFWFWDAQQWQAMAVEDSQVWPPPLIRSANGATWIHTDQTPDSQHIQLVVDSMEVLRARDSVIMLKVPLQWPNGVAIKAVEDSTLLGNDSTIATSGAIRHYIDSRPAPGLNGFINIADYGILPDSSTDWTDTLNALLAAHPGGTFIFPDGNYKGRIQVNVSQTLLSPGGGAIFTTDSIGASGLTINAPCRIEGLHFVHLDSTDGSMGLLNNGQDVDMKGCSFVGYEHHVAPQFSTSTFDRCRFTCTKESLGSLCWSPDARFTNCTFDGVIGADVMDSKFYHCDFSGLWGIHMPEGAFDNNGDSTGYTGIGEFHHCEILGSYYYAIGLGNKAHARLYNCVVIGFTSGAYARTASTFEAYNSYIACTKAGGASTALKFAKYITAEKAGIGLQDEGDSYFFGCRFENKGTPSGFHMIVPDKSDAGRAYFNGCQFDIDKICTEDTASICNGDVYRYIVYEGGAQETPHQTATVASGEVIRPQFSAGNVTYLDLTGDGGPASSLRLSKLYGSDREFPLGYQLVIRCGSNTNTITLKQGYYAPLAVGLFTANGQDLQLGENEVATFVYAKNLWIQTSPNGALFGDQNGNLQLAGTLKLANGTTVNEFSTDATLANNSNVRVPTEQAVKGYVDNLVQKQSQANIGSDGALSVSVPAGYRIRSLVLAETGNASPGPIQIGTSSGGSQVLQNYVLTGGSLGDTTPLKRVFSLTQNQGLFISSSNWNGAQVSVFLNLEKIN